MCKLYIVTIAIIAGLLCPSAHAAPNLFGKREVVDRDTSEFTKWLDVLERYTDEEDEYSEECEVNSKKFFCNIKEWMTYIDSIKDQPQDEQIKLVNTYANKHKYIIDQINWGMADYWETPGEFLFKNGDCEDYAIIKYMSLKRLGFNLDDMRIVILNDNNLKEIHAILAVYHEGTIKILDNQISKVMTHDKIYHYSPIYSINESRWWRHI